MHEGRTITELRRMIRDQWPAIVAKSGVDPKAVHYLPKAPKLFGASTKTEKGEAFGVLTAVVYLAPADEAFPCCDHRTLCPGASESCRNSCLGHSSGRMIFDASQRSRLWKTALYAGARDLFVALAIAECKTHARRARNLGMIPAVRFDGSSDTGVGRIIARHVPGIQFYDYTKVYARLAQNRPENYHLTYSFSGENTIQCNLALRIGLANVAVVFDVKKGAPLPATHWGFPVIDGDLGDARFTDPKGVVVGLRFKSARKVDAPADFVVSPE